MLYQITSDTLALQTMIMPYGLCVDIIDNEIRNLSWGGDSEAKLKRGCIQPRPDRIVLLFMVCCEIQNITIVPEIDRLSLSKMIHKITFTRSILRVDPVACSVCHSPSSIKVLGKYDRLSDVFSTLGKRYVDGDIVQYETMINKITFTNIFSNESVCDLDHIYLPIDQTWQYRWGIDIENKTPHNILGL